MEGKTNIFYDDSTGVSCKTGFITDRDNLFITLTLLDGRIIQIPINRIVRIEQVSA